METLPAFQKDEIKKRFEDNYIVKINVAGGVLNASAKNKNNDWNWKKSLSISFKVYVPGDISTDLSTSGGSIKLGNLNGSQVLEQAVAALR